MSLHLRIGAATDVGRVRDANEDAYAIFADADLVVVADGMGGHRGGEVASAAALEALGTALERGDPLDDAIRAANKMVYDRSREDSTLRGMGTTLTAVKLDGAGIVVGHVGDSRALYLLRAGALQQLTDDHSLVAELVRAGELTEEQAERDPRRAMITRAVGIDQFVEPQVAEFGIEAGDRLLVCTDGLTTMIHDADIAGILVDGAESQEAADRLVAAANAAGGLDNVTVVVLDVFAGEDPDDGENPEGGASSQDGDETGEMPVPAIDADATSDRPRRWWRRER